MIVYIWLPVANLAVHTDSHMFALVKFRELLISFRRATGQKPLRIIFYRLQPSLLQLSYAVFAWLCLLNVFFSLHRDGVSEGQFYQVLLYELDAIRKVIFILCFIFYVIDFVL